MHKLVGLSKKGPVDPSNRKQTTYVLYEDKTILFMYTYSQHLGQWLSLEDTKKESNAATSNSSNYKKAYS